MPPWLALDCDKHRGRMAQHTLRPDLSFSVDRPLFVEEVEEDFLATTLPFVFCACPASTYTLHVLRCGASRNKGLFTALIVRHAQTMPHGSGSEC